MTGVFVEQPLASPVSANKRVNKKGSGALTLPPFSLFNIKEQVKVVQGSNPIKN